LIRGDKIDILVDLTMRMSGGRPMVFAQKPAPIQVAWLAYPGTTGLANMDYRFTDPLLDPPDVSDGDYSEQSIRLPKTFWCYDPLASEPSVNPLPASSSNHFTFGCLNNFCKLNDPTLELWSRVLAAVKNSRLILLAPLGDRRRHALEKLNVPADRVEFVLPVPRRQYLQTYHRIDLVLDTLPYNGHTTTLDSLWMGVPVVTLPGNTAVGRGGLSLLTNIVLPELIATDANHFVQIAAALANDLPRLSKLRSELRSRLQHSPLMDGKSFAQGVEAAYREIWQRWCQSESK
jgi:predicted O-linked N-acetylglucosamine transferase (SPINDLY family)